MRAFVVSVIRYQIRFEAYLGLLTDRYPPFSLSGARAWRFRWTQIHCTDDGRADFTAYSTGIPSLRFKAAGRRRIRS
jgi:hypothetical protein